MSHFNSQDWWAAFEGWNHAHDFRFHIRAADVSWNFSEQILLQYRTATLCGTPVVYAVASDRGLAAGLSQSSIWLAFWGGISEGREVKFIKEFEALAQKEGKSRLVMGGDEFHFVPGVPVDILAGDTESKINFKIAPHAEGLKAALVEAEFVIGEVADFTGEVQTQKVNSYIESAEARTQEGGWRFLPVTASFEKEALQIFLSKEFPGRWTREFTFWLERRDTGRATWHTLHRESNEILGFARTALRSRFLPLDSGWSPGALRLPLSGQESESDVGFGQDACLGPIGVAASQRGKGAGKILLGKVLESLRLAGAGRVCIDWTDAFKYYEPLGFEVARRYWTASKRKND